MPDPHTPPAGPPSWGQLGRRLLLSSLAALTVLALVRSAALWGAMGEAALLYDLRYDPLVIENGELHAEGPRLPGSPEQHLYVDPTDALDLTTLPDPVVVFRKTEVLQLQQGRRQAINYRELQTELDVGTLRLDSAAISAFKNTYGPTVMTIAALTSVAFGLVAYGASLAAIIGLAGVLCARFVPVKKFPAAMWSRRAAAYAVFVPPLWLLLELMGAGSTCCVDVVVFPWLLAMVTVWRATARRGRLR